jgi:endonuclease-3
MPQKPAVNIEEFYAKLEDVVKDYPPPLVQKVFQETRSELKALITCILSARTADKTTETRLPELWKKAGTLKQLEDIPEEELAKILYPIGFYKNKARLLKKLPHVLKSEFYCIVPDTIDDLVKLPGVGRKTANLIVSVCFNKPGICVDTHVHRMMNYIGYVKTKTPQETEIALRKKLPKHLWAKTNYIFVILGQTLCTPTQIKKGTCPLNWYRLR